MADAARGRGGFGRGRGDRGRGRRGPRRGGRKDEEKEWYVSVILKLMFWFIESNIQGSRHQARSSRKGRQNQINGRNLPLLPPR